MRKALITITVVILLIPLYAGRADFELRTPTAPVPLASGTTTPLVIPTANVEFRVKTVKAWITAYSSTPDQTKSYGSPFITAHGTRVHDGVIATNMLPFGTKVKIPSLFGDKIFTVEDRMSPKKKHVFDIWMYSRNQALDFGAHYAEIIVINHSPLSLAFDFPVTINL